MPIAYETISGDDATYFQADEPTLFALTRLTDAEWDSDIHGNDTEDNAAGYPCSNAYDGHCGAITKPSAAAETWYFVGDLPGTTVDALFIHIHDADGAAVTVYLSDGATDHAITSIASDYFAGAKRLFCPMLQVSGDSGNTQRRFTGATLVIIKFYKVGDCTPEVTEVAAGRQRQLYYGPLQQGWDDEARHSNIEQFKSKSGIDTQYESSKGHKVMKATWQPNSSTFAAKFSDFHADRSYGLYPWVWCPNPQSAPNTAWLMTGDVDFAMPYRGPILREVEIAGIEQGGSLLVDE